MAEKLDDFNFTRKGRQSATPYHWDDWFNGEIWKLTQGEDFSITAASFGTCVYPAAYRRGLRVRVNVRGDTVILQAYKKED